MSDNIKVVVKVRPLITREIEEKLSYQWRVKNNTLYQIDHNGREFGQSFTFDKVYDDTTRTSDVYNDVAKPIVEAATAGFNGTIFAYGQTSSGKTYTMTGTKDSPGIIQMAVLDLFQMIKNIPDRDFLVRVSYIEIYNETVKDLLNMEKENIKIQETFNGIKVDVTESVTSSPEEVFGHMKMGEVNRQTGATNMNENSSRSHSIFQIIIESREHIEGEEESGCVNVSQLNLVDLAGSERAGQTGATGMRFKEGTHINKSLSALALVIKQLSEDPNKFANYRDSKLTRILQNSLGGNAKTTIICAVTPAAIEETISTLQFANRAKAIKNKPEVNEVTTNATMIQGLTKQLSRLKTQLESKKNVEQDNYNLQKQIANLQKFILNGFGQKHNADVASNRRKNDQLRRKTISTIHSIEEEPAPAVRKFCTPILKYNPMLIPGVSELGSVQSRSTLASLPEEPCTSDRAITPPPHKEKQVNFNDEIIEIDSDDDELDSSTKCSPYHKCYGATKTPPCVLRKNAKKAEKSLQDIICLTEREKIYTPSTVELLEKLENNATVIIKLQEEVESLNKESRDKDFEVEQLKAKVKKAEEEMKNIADIKVDLESKCINYETRLTDSEVSYETLKQKAKRREEELLSLLEEQTVKNNKQVVDGVLTKKMDSEISNFMDMSKEISLVDSENESSILLPNQSDHTLQLLISDLQTQVTYKNNLITELEANLNANKQRIDHFENSNKELQEAILDLKKQFSYIQEENSLYKSTIDTLNSTIKEQKQNLEIANSDMESYNSVIQELQIKLTNKDNLNEVNFTDSMLQNMIDNEEKFIANNENIKNIVQCFKLALDSRTKEIDSLKSNIQNIEDSKDLQKELDAKVKEVFELNEKYDKLNVEIKKHVLDISNLMEDKRKLMTIETDLTNKISSLQKYNEELLTSNKEKDVNIDKLKAEKEELSFNMTHKLTTENKLINENQTLLERVNHLSSTVTELENVVKEKSMIVVSLQDDHQKTQEYIDRAKLTINKLQNIVALFKNDIQKVPDNISDFVTAISILHSNLDILEVILTDYIKQNHDMIKSNKELAQSLSSKDLELSDAISESNELRKTIEELSIKYEAIDKQSQEFKLEIESERNKICNLEEQLKEMKATNESLKSELLSKCSMAYGQEQNNSITSEKLESLEHEIDALNYLLKSKEDSYAQALTEKENDIKSLLKNLELVKEELSGKCIALDSMTQQITTTHTQMNQAQNDRDLLMTKVLTNINSMTNEFGIENNLSCQFVDANVNIYEQTVLTLEKIRTHLKVLASENATTSQSNDIHEILAEAKKEITELTKQNMQLRENLSDMENQRTTYLMELERIRMENGELNKNLITSQDLLCQLKVEMAVKYTELENMQQKARGWKDEFSDYDRQIKEQMKEMQIENERLKIFCHHDGLTTLENNAQDLESSNSEKQITHKNAIRALSPPSLLTICCDQILNYIQPKDSVSKSVTPATSSTDIELDKIHRCQCEQLSMTLNMVQGQCSALALTVQQLETENEHLINEREDLRTESNSLIELAFELQKKIANHKTNLSILTATTYAENKLLKSQVKVLQHYHSRFHNVCERDLPDFKKQLRDLFSILTESSDWNNMSIKRYSLPNVLEKNTTVTNLKNESTLDGDLLMLDTNITLTTAADNTLVGYENSCLDFTQSLYNEASCQTNELNLSTDLNIGLLRSENDVMNEKIELLREENHNLREQLKSLINKKTCTSEGAKTLIQENKNENAAEPMKPCSNCENNKEMLIKYNTLLSERECVMKELLEIKEQKDNTEQKYNNLCLDAHLRDELVDRNKDLEKDCNEKLLEITKLSNTLNNKNKQLKLLQEENDSLSNQVMENVSELDDLSKKLENYEQKNSDLSLKCQTLESELALLKTRNDSDAISCPECTLKGEISHSRQRRSISQPHSKLNRSYSDSDTSTRYNKICTLQNELHAGREDCIELTEDVTTIKNHLDRSNLSMELDITMGDPSVFTCSKELASGPQANTAIMPEIPEECQLEIYLAEKNDCLNYYIQNCGNPNETLNQNLKIIDIMKMFYNNIMIKHSNELENLVNKLKDFNESKHQMQDQIIYLTGECSKFQTALAEKETYGKDVNVLTQIKNNVNLLRTQLLNTNNNRDFHNEAVVFFKDNVLKLCDYFIETSTMTTFEVLFNAIMEKHDKELNEINDKYITLKKQFENITAQLTNAEENLAQIQVQFMDKEKEYDLLKRQKDCIFEISNAVTKDIVQKERELNNHILNSCRKLKEQHDIDVDIIDLDNTVINNLCLTFEQISKKITLKLEREKEIAVQDVKKYNNALQIKEASLTDLKTRNEQLEQNINTVTADLTDKEKKLQTLVDLHENLKQVYESKVRENMTNVTLVEKLNEEIEILKEAIRSKEADIATVTEEQNKIAELMNTVNKLNNENQSLKTINDVIIKERDECKIELETAKETIQKNKNDFNEMNSDILILRESVKESGEVIETLKNEAKSLLAQNLELKSNFDEKCLELSRLQTNIKTHVKTAEIHSKIITRLKKQKEDDELVLKDKEKQIDELRKNSDEMEKECKNLKGIIETSSKEMEQLKLLKESLEARVTELELTSEKRRLSIETIADMSRRRRQSLHDSKRLFTEDRLQYEDQNNVEAIFESRPKPDDLFMDVDGELSNRSTPSRLSKGRDSLISRTDQSEKEEELPSRPNSVLATRRRRQSTHDLHRSVVDNENRTRNTPSPCGDTSPKCLLDDIAQSKSKDRSSNSDSEVSQLKTQLASCQAELEDLREKYREVDEECEICSQYLRERDEQCIRLKNEKKDLEQQLTELRTKLNSSSSGAQNRITVNASVNTDEDWTKLHSLVVDRMSYDAEVEKNKKLSKVIEELRFKKQELKNNMAKMHRAMQTHHDMFREELETARIELYKQNEELEELRERCKELDDECETCGEYLKERDAQIRKLTEVKDILEAKLKKYEEESKLTMSVRKKRQSAHDQNRNSSFEVRDATTDTKDDLESEDNARKIMEEKRVIEIRNLKLVIETMQRQHAALEQQLIASKMTPAQPLYVATGSAIVQNQQITDVMKENHKLKKINAKLLNLCKKRGNRENEEPSEQT